MAEEYLYKSFRLGKVNTAQDLSKPANPFVSAAVLVAGLVIAVTLFMMHRATVVADNLYEGNTSFEESPY